MPRQPFDPFLHPDRQDEPFDPFGRMRELEAIPYTEAIERLERRIAELEDLANARTAMEIITHLRESRRRLELMLDLANKEIDTLRLERDVALENLGTHKRVFAAFARAYWSRQDEKDGSLQTAIYLLMAAMGLDYLDFDDLHAAIVYAIKRAADLLPSPGLGQAKTPDHE